MSVAPRLAAPGLLYFDPNPTTARLTTAGLRLAGYDVFHALDLETAVDLAKAHGPDGDASIRAVLLDAAASAELSGLVLRALLAVPGSQELPGVLLVSRSNPHPIPGAESLPSLKRPFTIPALLKLLREALDDPAEPAPLAEQIVSERVVERVRSLLAQHFPQLVSDPAQVRAFVAALAADAEIPHPIDGTALLGHLSSVRFDTVLSVLDQASAVGVLSIEDGPTVVRLHLDRGRIRFTETDGLEEDLRLGRFIIDAGFLSADALEAALGEPDAARRPLGQRLVDEGRLTTSELGRVLLEQAREVACHLLEWREGFFMFSPTEDTHPMAQATQSVPMELRIAGVLLEGLRRLEERAEMGPEMPTPDEVFVRDDVAVAQMGRAAFSRDELSLLELINGRTSVKELARKTRVGVFAVATVLFRLWRSGLLHRKTTPVQT